MYRRRRATVEELLSLREMVRMAIGQMPGSGLWARILPVRAAGARPQPPGALEIR